MLLTVFRVLLTGALISARKTQMTRAAPCLPPSHPSTDSHDAFRLAYRTAPLSLPSDRHGRIVWYAHFTARPSKFSPHPPIPQTRCPWVIGDIPAIPRYVYTPYITNSRNAHGPVPTLNWAASRTKLLLRKGWYAIGFLKRRGMGVYISGGWCIILEGGLCWFGVSRTRPLREENVEDALRCRYRASGYKLAGDSFID